MHTLAHMLLCVILITFTLMTIVFLAANFLSEKVKISDYVYKYGFVSNMLQSMVMIGQVTSKCRLREKGRKQRSKHQQQNRIAISIFGTIKEKLK